MTSMNDTDEWYSVSRVTEQTYRIVEGVKYGMFLLEGSERALLIDAGAGVGDLRGLVNEYVDVPVILLLTHTHWDHIGNAAQFSDVRVSDAELPADGRVQIDGLSEEFTHRPKEFAQNWLDAGNEFPDEFDPETFKIKPTDASPIKAGTEFDLGNRVIELYAVPGHSPGQLAALDPDERVLYGGDVIHTDDNIYAHFQNSDAEAYRDTFQRLIEMRNEGVFSRLATSHSGVKMDDELSILDDLYDGFCDILDDELDYEFIETSWGEAHEYRIGNSQVLTSTTL